MRIAVDARLISERPTGIGRATLNLLRGLSAVAPHLEVIAVSSPRRMPALQSCQNTNAPSMWAIGILGSLLSLLFVCIFSGFPFYFSHFWFILGMAIAAATTLAARQGATSPLEQPR